MYIYCDTTKFYAEIPAGSNSVSRVFQGTGKKEMIHPRMRNIVEIPAGLEVKPGTLYDGQFRQVETPQDKAISASGKALDDRRIKKLVETSPVDALLIKGGLK